MKRSDLKKYIREEIINTLSEQKPIPGFGIGKDDVELDKLRKGFEKAKSGADFPPEATVQDIAAYYSANPPKMVSEDEDEDDEDAIRGAKKAKGKTKRYDLAVAGFKKIEREMRSLAKDYSKAEGAAKENLLAKLKELTKKKKEAKELVDKYADDVV